MPRVFPGPGAPEFVAREVIPIVQLHAHLAPTWCHELEVGYRTHAAAGLEAEEDDIASYTLAVDAQQRYRRAVIWVGAIWHERDDPAWRSRTIIHEICHLYNAALQGFAQYLVEQISEEGQHHRATLDRTLEEVNEGGVEDMADLVWRLTDRVAPPTVLGPQAAPEAA